MQCELCGKESNKLFRAEIEGAVLLVCKNCLSYGRKLAEKREDFRPKFEPKIFKPRELEEYVLVDEYWNVIRKAREKQGLSREQLAKKIFEKESVIRRLEEGTLEPSIELARKLEKALQIKIIE